MGVGGAVVALAFASAALAPAAPGSTTPAAPVASAAAAPKPIAAAEPPPIEYTLTIKDAAWRVRVTLRPRRPEPGQPLDILLDVARHPDVPDPTFGDRIPL